MKTLVGREGLEPSYRESESRVLAAERPPYGWEGQIRTAVVGFKDQRPATERPPSMGWRVGVPPTWHRFTADGLQSFDLRHIWCLGRVSITPIRLFRPSLIHLSYPGELGGPGENRTLIAGLQDQYSPIELRAHGSGPGN